MAFNILVTNDDGIASDGIRRLAEAAKEFGTVTVVAPASQCSAASHSITLNRTLEVHPYDFPVEGIRSFACSGTPADCVRIGILNILKEKPAVVLSGINYGYNLANDIQYSATLGAAFEAEFAGCPAIAFSEAAPIEATDETHGVSRHYLRKIMADLIEKPYVAGQVWNVNFPGCPLEECKGILRDRTMSRQAFYEDHYQEIRTLPDGGMELEVKGVHKSAAEEGTDYAAIEAGWVSIGTVRNYC